MVKNEPIRLQKFLAQCGVASRRKAEELIVQGKVKINGKTAVLGDKVNANDKVYVSGKRVILPKTKFRYIMLNKPRGFITTMHDERGRRCVAELVQNVGAFANKVMHPRNSIYKFYRVTVRPDITEEQLVKLETGVELDGVKTAPAIVHVLHKEHGRVVMEMILHEGKNREIRRMCEALGLEVARLRRTQIGGVKMGMLKQGDWRDLTEKEVKNLLANPLVNGRVI